MNGVSRMIITEDIAFVTIAQIVSDIPHIAGIFSDFAEAKINIDMISHTIPTSGHIDVSVTLPGTSLPQVLELVGRFRDNHPALKLKVCSGNCKIQLYGEEMREMHGVTATALNAIAQAEAELLLITTSEVDISMLTTRPRVTEAVKALEQAFSVISEWV